MEKIFVNLCILFGLYALVLCMILADLWSGVRKARRQGDTRTSYGYKRTVQKIAMYYNALIALSIIDAMQMSAIWYLEQFYDNKLWFFPFVTLIGAIGIGLIELKSIYEKVEDKVRVDSVVNLAGKVIANKDDLKEIVKEVTQYIKSNETEKEQTND